MASKTDDLSVLCHSLELNVLCFSELSEVLSQSVEAMELVELSFKIAVKELELPA